LSKGSARAVATARSRNPLKPANLSQWAVLERAGRTVRAANSVIDFTISSQAVRAAVGYIGIQSNRS
jgi:hypothetical protein